jgi:hypothetical protein
MARSTEISIYISVVSVSTPLVRFLKMVLPCFPGRHGCPKYNHEPCGNGKVYFNGNRYAITLSWWATSVRGILGFAIFPIWRKRTKKCVANYPIEETGTQGYSRDIQISIHLLLNVGVRSSNMIHSIFEVSWIDAEDGFQRHIYSQGISRPSIDWKSWTTELQIVYSLRSRANKIKISPTLTGEH